MSPFDPLGMKLQDALALCKAQGLAEPTIRVTYAPKGPREGGMLRVIRVRDGEWTVSAFLDDTPTE